MPDPGAPSAAVAEVTFTAGTGDYQLNGSPPNALAAYFRFGDVFADGEVITYEVDDTAKKEIVRGTFNLTANTLSRTTVLFSNNGNAPIDWPTTGQRIIRPLIGFPLCDTPPTDGQVLAWDANKQLYCPKTLTDTPVLPLCDTPPTDGQILVFDATTGKYCPADLCALVAACLGTGGGGGGSGAWIVETGNAVADFVDPSTGRLSKSISVTTIHPNDVILLHVVMNSETAPTPTVSSVNGAGLVWTRRTAQGVFPTNAPNFYGATEVWWAIAPTPLTGAIITANVNSGLGWIGMEIRGFNGANLTTPFDVNPSLPKVTLQPDTGGLFPSEVIGISTTSPNAMVLLFYLDFFGAFTISATGPITPSPMDATPGSHEIQAFIGLGIDGYIFNGVAAAPLINQTIVTHRLFPAADGPLGTFILIADALQPA